jgi:hypothetical protein
LKAYSPPAGSPSLFPAPGSGEEHARLFESEIGVADQIAIVSIIRDATEETHAEAKARLPNGFPPAHAEGHDRYAGIHDRLLALDRDDFSCKHNRHPNGTTSYTAIETPNVRALVRRLESKGHTPKNGPFWAAEHRKQNDHQFDLEEFKHKVLAEITYGLTDDRSEVAFVEARFPDGNGGYFERTVNMLAAINAVTFAVPMEDVDDARSADVKSKTPKTTKRPA